ncbi:dynein intermediate chain 2, ciliary-like [Schistocerca piceifrons]|uniref:dynein intermediate chain 2, ciliary-like n=1 Tax=Schistocerca piceifrons TaxID=274613 RepID=UPI001F5F912A|nr:dynein intermediate chain 2, ciliary-like [Schistocerca piceifrons]
MQSKSAYTAAKAQSKTNDPSRQSIKHARQADAGEVSARKSRPAIVPGGRRHGNSGVAVGAKLLLKPDDQLELTDEELKDEVTRVLTSNHAQIVTDLVEYSYKEGRYVVLPSTGATFIIFRTEGTILHKDSDEARQQLFGEGGGFVPTGLAFAYISNYPNCSLLKPENAIQIDSGCPTLDLDPILQM